MQNNDIYGLQYFNNQITEYKLDINKSFTRKCFIYYTNIFANTNKERLDILWKNTTNQKSSGNYIP